MFKIRIVRFLWPLLYIHIPSPPHRLAGRETARPTATESAARPPTESDAASTVDTPTLTYSHPSPPILELYIFTHTYIHTYIHKEIIRILAYTHIHTNSTYIHTYMYIQTVHTNSTYIHTYIQTVHTYIHTVHTVHTYTQTYRTYKHTYKQTYIHTYIHSLTLLQR